MYQILYSINLCILFVSSTEKREGFQMEDLHTVIMITEKDLRLKILD